MLRRRKVLQQFWDHAPVKTSQSSRPLSVMRNTDEAMPISRQYETKLFEHYNQKPYWLTQSEITLTG